DTNITGTIYLVQLVGRTMRSRAKGRILPTGSIAGFMPGTFTAVYNGTKTFIDSFSFALRAELKDTGVTVTCLMPGATDGVLRARRHAGHESRPGPEGRPGGCGARRLRCHDARRRRRRQRLEEQTANGDGQRHPRRRPRRTTSQDGRARVGEEGQGLGAACPMTR